MTMGLEKYWDKAVGFGRWLDQVEANRDLWRGIYHRAAVQPEVVDRVDGPFRLLALIEREAAR